MKKPVTGGRLRASNVEEMTARAVVAYLRAEGRIVEGPHRPPLGLGRSPDFILNLDGSPAALEVVRFLEPKVRKAEARVRVVELALKARLRPTVRRTACKLVLRIAFEVLPLQAYGSPDVERDADRLASRILELVRVWPDGLEAGVRFDAGVPWIKTADLSAWPSAKPSFCIDGIASEPGFGYTDAAAFLDRTITAKGTQHLGYATAAILAIRSEFDDADRLRRAFAEADEPIPWWRVYDVWSGGNASLVYDGDAIG